MHRLACLLLMLAVAGGCNATQYADTRPDAGGDQGGDDGSGGGGGGGGPDANPGLDEDGDHVDDIRDNCPHLANADQLDGDGDHFGDVCDCDPVDAAVAAEFVAKDALAADSGLFAAGDGFAGASWRYANSALDQTRLVNNATDVALLQNAAPLTNVLFEVTAASTEIVEFDATDLRQIFLLARASSAADKFAAIGCGIEVVEGLTPTQKTSAVTLAGKPAAVTTTALRRTDRAAVQVNEQFRLRMDLQGDKLTCTATIGGVKTTATATGLSVSAGSVGLLARETKAAFKNVRICAYR